MGAIYASLVWWAAMYLNHHFLVDLLGGLFYVIVCYMAGMLVLRFLLDRLKEKIYSRGGLAIVRINSQDKLQDMELVMVETHEDIELDEEVDLEDLKGRSNPVFQRSRSKEEMELPSENSFVTEIPLLKEPVAVHPSPIMVASPAILVETSVAAVATPDQKRKNL